MSLIGFATLSETTYNKTNFYQRLIDINKGYIPMPYHECYNQMTSNETMLFKDPLQKFSPC